MKGSILRIVLLTVLGLSFVSYIPVALADKPFAIKADVPKRQTREASRRLAVQNLKFAQVPSEQEVGVPAYPNAKIVMTSKFGDLSQVHLISMESPARVADYYRRNLAKWRYEETYGSHNLWRSGEKYDPKQDPDIIITGTDVINRYLMPSAKSEIIIRYKHVNDN